jgi:glycosyltransferase involved in cell wall biosynthesis
MMSSVSLIIPTSNRLPLLQQTLDNVLAQTVSPYEIIVVDDHSTDGTLGFLKKDFSSHVIAIESKGKGPGAARNHGLEIATGKYVRFFDSDDLMSPNSLEVQQRALQNSSAGFLYSPYLYARQEGAGRWVATDPVLLNYYPFSHRQPIHYWMVRGLFLAIPGMLFRRELLEKAGPWPESLLAYEDWEFLWRVGLEEPYPAHTNECCFLYRQHGRQTTLHNSSDQKRDREAVLVFEKILSEYFESYTISPLERIMMQSRIYKIARKHPAEPFFRERLIQFNPVLYGSLLKYLQVLNKIERLRTKSNWSRFYGPETSTEHIDKCLQYFQ